MRKNTVRGLLDSRTAVAHHENLLIGLWSIQARIWRRFPPDKSYYRQLVLTLRMPLRIKVRIGDNTDVIGRKNLSLLYCNHNPALGACAVVGRDQRIIAIRRAQGHDYVHLKFAGGDKAGELHRCLDASNLDDREWR